MIVVGGGVNDSDDDDNSDGDNSNDTDPIDHTRADEDAVDIIDAEMIVYIRSGFYSFLVHQ